MRRLRDDSGIALVTAIMAIAIMLSLGLAVTQFANVQQHAAGAERTHESSFNEAESVLNAQIYQFARTWPTAAAPATSPCLPTTAGAGTTATTCPDPASISGSFTTVDYNATSGCAYAPWQVTVQDDNPTYGGTQYYDPVNMKPGAHPAVPYDANNNNTVWVRVTAAPQCRAQTVVALATRSLKPLSWPLSVITADWFKTGNAGNKVIINTAGPNSGNTSGAGNVSLRCAGNGHTTQASCQQYRAGQVAPPTVGTIPSNATPIIGPGQLDSLRQQAQQSNTYSSGCSLPASGIAALPKGTVVFSEGGPTCTLAPSGNTAANPIIFVLNDGKISLGGNSAFYGLMYAHNASGTQASDPAVVTLGGCAHIQGLIAIDGFGGVDVGSCKQNLVYDPTILGDLKTFGGAVVAKDSFRVIPST